MIDTSAITGKTQEQEGHEPAQPQEPAEPTPVQQQEPESQQEQQTQGPEPQQEQQTQGPEPQQEQPQESQTEQAQEQEGQAEQQDEAPEQDTIFNGMSYIELIATAFMLGSLTLLVLTRSAFSIKAFGISILVAFLIECCKPMRK